MNRRGTLVAGVAIAAAAVGAGVAWQRRAAPGEDVERDLWRARFDRGFAVARHDQGDGVEEHRMTGLAVDRIADDRDTDAARRVNAKLMRAAGFGLELDQRAAVHSRQHAPGRARGFALRVGDHPPAVLARRRLGKCHVDEPLLLRRNTVEHGEIGLFDDAGLERLGEAAMRLGMARDAALTAGALPASRSRPAYGRRGRRDGPPHGG